MYRDHLVELLLGHLAHRRVAGDPGVVDHDVETAELLDCGADQCVDLVRPGHVASHRQRDIGAELLGGGLGRGEIQIAEHHPGALGDEEFGDRKPRPCAPPVTTAVCPVSNDT